VLTESHPEADLPHSKQIFRAERVESLARELTPKVAVDKVAAELNVEPRSIYRAVRYRKSFLRVPSVLQPEVAEFVNSKYVTVDYVRRKFGE
jgi:hypothetical protein